MLKILLGFILMMRFCSTEALADLRQVTFDTTKVQNKRDAYFPQYNLLDGEGGQEHWSHNVTLGVDYDLFKAGPVVGYWDQKVMGYSTNYQYRKVLWDWELGARLYDRVSIFWHHRSEHGLEYNASNRKYPIEDLYGIRFYLYRR
jgi:hypothetical protein